MEEGEEGEEDLVGWTWLGGLGWWVSTEDREGSQSRGWMVFVRGGVGGRGFVGNRRGAEVAEKRGVF